MIAPDALDYDCPVSNGVPHPYGFVACPGGLACFAPRSPLTNLEVLACPVEPGSRRYLMVMARMH